MLESLAVIRWAEGRWCNATWGERIGQSCWSQRSRGCSPTRGSGRGAAAAAGGAGTAEEQRGTAGPAAGEEGRGRPSCTAQNGDEKVGGETSKEQPIGRNLDEAQTSAWRRPSSTASPLEKHPRSCVGLTQADGPEDGTRPVGGVERRESRTSLVETTYQTLLQGAEVVVRLLQQQLQLAARHRDLLSGLSAVLWRLLRLELGPQQLQGGVLGLPLLQLLPQVLWERGDGSIHAGRGAAAND